MKKAWIILAFLIFAISCSKNDKAPVSSPISTEPQVIPPTPEEVLSVDEAKMYHAAIGLMDEFSEGAKTGQELEDAEQKAIEYASAQYGVSVEALTDIIDRYNLAVVEFYFNNKSEQ